MAKTIHSRPINRPISPPPLNCATDDDPRCDRPNRDRLLDKHLKELDHHLSELHDVIGEAVSVFEPVLNPISPPACAGVREQSAENSKTVQAVIALCENTRLATERLRELTGRAEC